MGTSIRLDVAGMSPHTNMERCLQTKRKHSAAETNIQATAVHVLGTSTEADKYCRL